MANVKLVYINGVGGYVQSTDAADEASSLGKLTLSGVGGIALDASSARIVNVATPTTGTDAANKSYVDSVASGLTWVAPVVVVATSNVTLSGSQTIDGVGVQQNQRVLIAGQNGTTPDVGNGIYIVNTVGAWTRSADSLQDGTAMFVQQGTTYEDTQWVLTTSNPITPGVTAISFEQFGGGATYSAGNGISIVGNTISASGDGTAGITVGAGGIAAKISTTKGLGFDGSGNIEIDADTTRALDFDGTTGALYVKADTNNAIQINGSAGLQVKADSTKGLAIDATTGLQVNADTNAGLKFDVGNGKLQVNPSSSGGLNFSSGALQINIFSADELAASASGLAVVGVPSLFKIAGSATSANVSATNLNALTDSSTITALHRHAVLNGATQTAAGVAAGNPVYFSNLGTLETSQASSAPTTGVVGVAITTGGASAVIQYATHGKCSAFSGLTTGAPYYLANSGGVDLYSGITSGNRAIRIGYALDASTLILNIQDMGVKP
jgi:hypothetical protein